MKLAVCGLVLVRPAAAAAWRDPCRRRGQVESEVELAVAMAAARLPWRAPMPAACLAAARVCCTQCLRVALDFVRHSKFSVHLWLPLFFFSLLLSFASVQLAADRTARSLLDQQSALSETRARMHELLHSTRHRIDATMPVTSGASLVPVSIRTCLEFMCSDYQCRLAVILNNPEADLERARAALAQTPSASSNLANGRFFGADEGASPEPASALKTSKSPSAATAANASPSTALELKKARLAASSSSFAAGRGRPNVNAAATPAPAPADTATASAVASDVPQSTSSLSHASASAPTASASATPVAAVAAVPSSVSSADQQSPWDSQSDARRKRWAAKRSGTAVASAASATDGSHGSAPSSAPVSAAAVDADDAVAKKAAGAAASGGGEASGVGDEV